jgi:hypothetical protein
MKPRIRHIISGWRYWDKTNGNSYYLTMVMHTGTGKSALFDECPDNLRRVIGKMEHKRTGSYDARVYEAPMGELSYREWQRKIKHCELATVYEPKKSGGLRNVTDKRIRELSYNN